METYCAKGNKSGDGDNYFTEEELANACHASGYNINLLAGAKVVDIGNTSVEGGNSNKRILHKSNVVNIACTRSRSRVSRLLPPISPAQIKLEQDPEVENLASSSTSHRDRRPPEESKTWKAQKLKRMHGETYLGYKKDEGQNGGKRKLTARPSRKMGPPCTSTNYARIQNRSCGAFTEDERKKIFQEFWSMNWESKKSYVRNLVDSTEPKVRRNVEGSRREKSHFYYLKIYGIKRQVCRYTFASTLGMRYRQLETWLKNPPSKSKYARERNVKSRPSSEKELFARAFLDSLPKLPSHYCRATTKKLYLEPIYDDFVSVYSHYKMECEKANLGYYSIKTFRLVFKSMNIGIFQPKKDKCDLCSSFEVGNLDPEVHRAHRVKAETALAEKSFDKIQAMDGKCHVLTMDVQAVLLAPVLTASSLYYKTKLIVHNFTVYDVANRNTACYLWNETEAELVASVFATCLRKYLAEHFDDQLPIVIFSDGCTNQNRNAILSNALLDIAMTKKKIIFQKFLEKGHTQMEVDSVHATIERSIKGKEIFVPKDYITHCAKARRQPEPYEVHYMTHTDFFDFSISKFQRYTSIRPGTKSGDAHVTDIRQLMYMPDGSIHYKLDYASEWTLLPRSSRVKFPKQFPKLYKTQLPISKRKFKDLQDLIPVLPTEHHQFYKSLPSLNNE